MRQYGARSGGMGMGRRVPCWEQCDREWPAPSLDFVDSGRQGGSWREVPPPAPAPKVLSTTVLGWFQDYSRVVGRGGGCRGV